MLCSIWLFVLWQWSHSSEDSEGRAALPSELCVSSQSIKEVCWCGRVADFRSGFTIHHIRMIDDYITYYHAHYASLTRIIY